MEVAGQWRREWAGTAEYGKITEGGVTRQVARAMEVLHASAPGTRVRVVRAAYHSTAGPGAPAASCLMHSSRRVISSGFNLLESPTTPSKPLEISSTPLESSPEYNTDTANYKVTEPDDHDISEPSKWRSSTAGSSARMPSEESSSADNASVIDLDARYHRNSPRKYSYDSENSDILHFKKSNARVSPLLDAPAALSTLKYKSLLNGSNDWNSRRKSYSFEHTSPLSESVLRSNDTLAMESSTDSGICKSNEIVNDVDDKYFDHHKEREHEENFKDWLFKHRSPNYFKGNSIKPYRDHDVEVERSFENNIALQSKGKVCITVPITLETDDDYQYKKTNASDENGRKVKKVEFCKTEVHFATETGKVNIIATDEKPPPSFDFRKRKSAFVPISGNFEKPITLFGENNKDFPEVIPNDLPIYSNNESGESDENTIATKSILKNKIPKPKPYLLGENMAFGSSDVINDKNERQFVVSSVPTAVSLINKQLHSEKRYSDDGFKFTTDVNKNTYRTISEGSTITEDIKNTSSSSSIREYKNEADSVKNKLKSFQMSPIQRRAKTRQLRDSDLTYFGIDRKPMYNEIKPIKNQQYKSGGADDLFQSVRLIQQVSRSNSVCNSEAESEDTPEYQNIPIRHNFAHIPTPKPRTKIDIKPSEIKTLKPVKEQDVETNADTRRSRFRRMDETSVTNRSLSAPPPKSNARFNENSTIHTEDQRTNILKKETSPTRSRRNHRLIDESFYKKGNVQNMDRLSEERSLYVNLREDKKSKVKSQRSDMNHRSEQYHADTSDVNPNKEEKESNKMKHEPNSMERKRERGSDKRDKERIRTAHHSRLETRNSSGLEKNEDSNKKIRTPRRTEKLATPEHSNEDHRKTHVKQINIKKSFKENPNSKNIDHQQQKEYRSQSSQRYSSSSPVVNSVNRKENGTRYLLLANEAARDNSQGKASEDKSSRRNSSRTRPKQDTNSLENHRKSARANTKEIIVSERSPSADSDKYKHSHSKKEYVINYDDKNGTVSSVCKINPAPASSKRKKLLKNNHVKDLKKHRVPEKNALRNAVPRSSMEWTQIC